MNQASSAHNESPWLFRYTLLLVLVTLFVVLAGSAVTSSFAVPSAADRTSAASQVQQTFPVPAGSFFAAAHPMSGRALSVLILVLVVWLFTAERTRPGQPCPPGHVWARWLSLLALVLVILQAGLGEMMQAGIQRGNTPSLAMSVTHASLAPILLSVVAAISLQVSAAFRHGPQPVHDKAASSLRLLTILLPISVVLQIVFGASYRHTLLGVMPHMGGAAIVTFLALMLCLQMLQKFPKHRSLKSATMGLLHIVLLQVALGITVFVMELLHAGGTTLMLLTTFAHIVNGSLTLAASLVFTIQVLRNLQPAVLAPSGSAQAGSVRA